MNTIDLAAAWAHAQHVAEQWAGRGIPAFPIAISHDPTKYDGTGGLNKRPLTEHGHLDATTNPDELAVLYADARRRARPGEQPGAGLCPGPAGYVQIDIDLKGGHNGYIAAANLGLQDTWGARTPSGGEHRMWRKPDPTKWVGNSSPWAGIDIRADAGWTVAPGTQTSWGAWSRNDIDAAQAWPDDVHVLPDSIWGRLDLHDQPPAVTHVTAQHQRQLNDHLAATLHPDTLAAWEHLRDHHGAHSALWNVADGRTWLLVTRPGKRGWGASAYIGSREHGQIWNLSSSWPGVPADTALYLVHGQLVDQTTWHTHQLDQWAPEAEQPDADLEELLPAPNIATVRQTDWDIHDLIASHDDPYDWLIEGLIERGDRTILTGLEGRGKSTLLRQIAITTAAGLHPFTFDPIDPIRVLYIDLENSERQIRRKTRPLYQHVHGQLHRDQLIFHIRPHGIDLTQPNERGQLHGLCDLHRPDLLIIGPIYKLHSGDPIEEKPAKAVATYLDALRTHHGCALLIEAHTPYAGTSKGSRPERPYGASLWSRWPEFGIFLNETGALTHWRGQRDERQWPTQLRRHDNNTWPWEIEENPRQVTYAAMVAYVRDVGHIPSQRDIAQHIGCGSTTVRRAIEANKWDWDLLIEELGE